jgi:hypothetical protein
MTPNVPPDRSALPITEPYYPPITEVDVLDSVRFLMQSVLNYQKQ